ncbi:class I adenylate-forming enzyme family protein [Tengunoibacter tsumagoiensis]|uniref:Long-chain-fatty-acid--CoA ligase n=1 Tax=Tengunoibacter tsumagoiensis TaxID=2014871 RepID=A0A402A7K1_9CHLR|nr:class I adenylate-forming enzyme family protein [Tengunoibacter tsumagoiensis]GCE14956.1 long-chain-fatty-acid--CoA ligase [Tengunoibacter tsumagoiensis]
MKSDQHTSTLISDAIFSAASICPEREAIIAPGRRLTYSALSKRIEALHIELQKHNIRPLEKIAWADVGTSHFVELLYAIGMSDAVGVPLHAGAPSEEWSMHCELCDVSTIIVPAAFMQKGQEIFARDARLQRILLIEEHNDKPVLTLLHTRERKEEHDETNKSEPGDAIILCSSGTTGRPKAIVLTHRNLLINQASLIQYMHITQQDRLLVSKPMIHSSTLIEVLSLLQAQGSIVLSPWLTARGTLAVIQREECTMSCIVPAMARELLSVITPGSEQSLLLRALSVSGSPVASQLLLDLSANLPHCGIYHAYGLTEAAPRVSALLPHELHQHSRSVGRSIPHVKVCIVDANDQPVPLGQIGELIVCGENVMRTYYGNPVETKKALRAPGLHTGDLAYIDEQGFIYLQGRIDDLINCGGQKVYPLEIEQVLLNHPAIAEALVQGQTDERLGCIPVASVVPVAGQYLEEQSIRAYCQLHLAAYKIPRHIAICTALAHTPSGKVQRRRQITESVSNVK